MTPQCPFQELEVDIEDVQYYVSTCAFRGPAADRILRHCKEDETVLLIFASRQDWIESLRHPDRATESSSDGSATYSLAELMDMQVALNQDIVCCDGNLNEVGRWRKPN